MNKHILDIAWVERRKLHAERDKRYAESRKLYIKWYMGQAERDEREAEGRKLNAEGRKLYVEGVKLWLDAVHHECGRDVLIEWPGDGSCIVAGVVLFLPV